jgi:hypothetical protein
MRLRDLDAQFIGSYGTKTDERTDREYIGYRRQGDKIDGAQGLLFQCPTCAVGKEPGTTSVCVACEQEIDDCACEPATRVTRSRNHYKGAHYIICWFRNPRGADRVPDDAQPLPGRWWIEGTSLDDLTLAHGAPHMARSVLLQGGCNAHFCVTAGEIAGC